VAQLQHSCLRRRPLAWRVSMCMAWAQVLEIERENMQLNGLSGRVLHLDWRDRAAAIRLGTYSLILSCDLLYVSAIVRVLHTFFALPLSKGPLAADVLSGLCTPRWRTMSCLPAYRVQIGMLSVSHTHWCLCDRRQVQAGARLCRPCNTLSMACRM
jgi:hypothetical protein